ncbi:hypothetical protein [Escherichia albertii]|uniref:hypothetical protein n=1 Tax=Escherichia albertii TaxID=208962 RepID=UPI000AAB0B46|nr:hypothetical protein [Escherichia albertii]WMV66473.1 hypothetical protein Q0121_21385 [Escherichia albertii]
MMTNAKWPDALRLSGLRDLCNILKLHVFVGWIRRSHRIRQGQSELVNNQRPLKKRPENDDKRKIA